MAKKWGKIHPFHFAFEFPLIEEQLQSRGIEYERIDLKTGGAVFRFHERFLPKLPIGKGGFRLPVTDESSYEIYEIKDDDIIFK